MIPQLLNWLPVLCDFLPSSIFGSKSVSALRVSGFVCVCVHTRQSPAFWVPHRHTNQCYISLESPSSQAVTRRSVGCLPLKHVFIMQLHSDLEGQKSTMLKPMPVNHEVYWSIGGRWCWEYTCLSVSNTSPHLAQQQMRTHTYRYTCIHTPLRLITWCH